jgi:hypothetical protein
LLFGLDYNAKLHKDVQNGVGVEIARFKREEAKKNNGGATKDL